MKERLGKVHMVMVNTTHPGNIGAAARAIKNMGLSSLILVDPKEFPSPKAVWRAAGAVDVLDNVRVVSTLDEAIADCGLVIGTSARERRIPWPLLTPRECGDKAWAETEGHDVAIVFGREDRGLTNEELHKCHFHVHIPANEAYSSLNISAAMQVIAYEIRMSYLTAEAGKAPHFDDWDMPPAKTNEMELYFTHMEETLEKLGFYDPKNPRQTMTRIRRMFNRVRMDEMELNIMRGLLTSIQNYIFRTDKKLESSENEK
ncbi:MAG: tRNA (cytosine(32)/uridine(32)-2'-O)-methyltransferase TrmJ [Agarilytica sp.]